MSDPLLMPSEVAKRLNATVQDLRRSPRFRSLPVVFTTGNHRRYREADVLEFIAQLAARHPSTGGAA